MARGGNRRRVDRGSPAATPRVLLRRFGPYALGLAVLASLAVSGRAAWRGAIASPALRIREIRVAGLVHASADELLALSPVRRGDHLLTADLGAMRAALARHPWVLEVSVGRRFLPPAVQVRVRERAAVALVDLGGLYLVDGDGFVFKRAAAGDGLDLPLVTGIGRVEYLQRRAEVEPLLQGALTLARTWRGQRREDSARLSEIHVDATEGTTLYVGDDGVQVRLGAGDLDEKLARLDKVMAALRAEGKRPEVLHLDNRVHPSWVTVRVATAEPAKGGGR